jgi:hypothetical protein
VIEVRPENKAKFEALFRSTPFGLLGTVTGGKTLKVTDKAGTAVINEKIEDLRTSWRSTLAW